MRNSSVRGRKRKIHEKNKKKYWKPGQTEIPCILLTSSLMTGSEI
jgi:hypothetical protein